MTTEAIFLIEPFVPVAKKMFIVNFFQSFKTL